MLRWSVLLNTPAEKEQLEEPHGMGQHVTAVRPSVAVPAPRCRTWPDSVHMLRSTGSKGKRRCGLLLVWPMPDIAFSGASCKQSLASLVASHAFCSVGSLKLHCERPMPLLSGPAGPRELRSLVSSQWLPASGRDASACAAAIWRTKRRSRCPPCTQSVASSGTVSRYCGRDRRGAAWHRGEGAGFRSRSRPAADGGDAGFPTTSC